MQQDRNYQIPEVTKERDRQKKKRKGHMYEKGKGFRITEYKDSVATRELMEMFRIISNKLFK
jgi:hypothetical protein